MEIPENSRQGRTGKVKWFDPCKGFGFIVGPEAQDVFVHYTEIQAEGFRALRQGTTVMYDAEISDKGWFARNVTRITRETEQTTLDRIAERPTPAEPSPACPTCRLQSDRN